MVVVLESPTRDADYEMEDFIDLLAGKSLFISFFTLEWWNVHAELMRTDLEDCESSTECKGSGAPPRPLPLPPACCKITFSGNNTAVLSSNSSSSLVYDVYLLKPK